MKKSLFAVVVVFSVACAMAGESITNIRKNVVNVKDGSSEINSGIKLNDSGGKKVVGNGKIVSKQIKVGAFSGLKATGAFELDVKCDSRKSDIVVKADSNLIELIRFNVAGGILNIAFTRQVSTRNPVKITINTNHLSDIVLNGSCEAKISGIKSDKFKLYFTGSCRGELAGHGVKKLQAILEGACSVNASKLISVNNVIRLSGSSEALIRSDGHIEVNAGGASELKYIGKPKIEQHLSGAASVSEG